MSLAVVSAICLFSGACNRSPTFESARPQDPGVILTIPFTEGEVPVSTAGRIAWSPDGETLGYLAGGAFHTELPKRRHMLPQIVPKSEYENTEWLTFLWRADGGAVLVTSEEKVIVMDVESGNLTQELQGDRTYWWLNNTLCSTQLIHEPDSNTIQSWSFGSETRKFPKGFTFAGASTDGRAILAKNEALIAALPPDDDSFSLIVLDDNGEMKWRRDLDPFGRVDLFDYPHISWNEQRNQAALSLDHSGGSTYRTSIQDQFGSRSLTLSEDDSGMSWSGVPRWLDNRFLFCPTTLMTMYSVNPITRYGNEWNRLTIYDAETAVLRPIYESAKMIDAVASDHYVAIAEKLGNEARIVVSAWKRDQQGRIISPDYSGDNEPLDGARPPLEFKRGKYSIERRGS